MSAQVSAFDACLTLLAAWSLSAYLTPAVARAARARGIVDRPDGKLKRHSAPVAYLGGVAVYLAFLLAVSASVALDQTLLALLLGGTLAMSLGLFDDLHALPPGLKLLGQIVGCLVLLRAGIGVQLTFLSPAAAAVVSVAWMLTVINAVNLLDVADGLAGSCCCVAALALAALAWPQQNGQLSLVAAALGGGLLGFLPHNVRPARIYLGDAGSLLLGFVLAAASMQASYTARHVWGALAPPMLLGVPLLELFVVSAIRIGLGRRPWLGSPHHMVHLLEARGLTAAQVARAGAVASFAGGASAYGLVWGTARLSLALLATYVAAAVVAAAWFIALGLRRGAKPVPR